MKSPKKALHSFCFFSFLLLSGCLVGPRFKKPIVPAPNTYVSKSFIHKTVTTQAPFGQSQHLDITTDIPKQWWELFHSKPLNDLIMTSIKHNPDVAAAKAALRASLENVYAQRGALYPSINLALMPEMQQTAGILASLLASNKYIYAMYTGQLLISYTADVFGGIRRQIESTAAQANYQRFQLEATYLTLTSNVAFAAIQEAMIREKIKITQEIIRVQKKQLIMMKKRVKLGDMALNDLAIQEVSLAVTEATLPPLENQLAIQRNLLNALTGRFPDDPLTPTFTLESLMLPTHLPISVPSTLIEHRPDVRAAEEQMRYANALIGVAIANRLPNFSLGFTNAGTSNVNLSTLFAPDSNFWSLAGILTQPLFHGGTLLHNQRAAVATYKQATAQYRSTVINAFQNVADTLKAIQFDAHALHAAKQAELAALKSLTIARRQFKLGEGTVLSIFINVVNYRQSQLNLIQAQANRLADTVALFQALGGGWGSCKKPTS